MSKMLSKTNLGSMLPHILNIWGQPTGQLQVKTHGAEHFSHQDVEIHNRSNKIINLNLKLTSILVVVASEEALMNPGLLYH